MTTLENNWLQLIIDPPGGTWRLVNRKDENIGLQNAGMQVLYRRGSSRPQTLSGWASAQITQRDEFSPYHGHLNVLEIQPHPDSNGLTWVVTFALPDDYPFLLWKTALQNGSRDAILVARLDMLRVDPASGGAVFTNPPFSPAFFSNGWQSWSYSGVYASADRFRRTRLGPLRANTEYNPETPQPSRPGHFGSDMFGILGDRAGRKAVLAGFLSQQQHFGSLEARIDTPQPSLVMWANGDLARLDPDASMETDWAYLQYLEIDQADPLGIYLEAVARQHSLHSLAALQDDPPTGWCSWYQFSSDQYTGTITPSALEGNLEALVQIQPDLPLDLYQIDDGFQVQIGDWFDFADEFPQGIAPLAEKALSSGLTPGIWLAPFIVHPKSLLASEHPEWLLRGRLGRPANAGYHWGALAAGLDVTHPEALEYASQVVHTAVHEWKFSYLKLDFLYAAALPGKRHDPTSTRAQALHAALKALRQAAGKGVYMLGCGCPLGPAIGLVDAMRIGPDTHRSWYPKVSGIESFFRREPGLPSAFNACHNAITRAPMHRRWWINDPDCLLLRTETALTEAEVKTAATVIAMTGGSLLLSDDLPRLTPERLHIAGVLLPLIGRTPQTMEWFDLEAPSRLRLDLENSTGAWHLLASINWDDEPQDITLNLREFGLDPQAQYFAREFWSQKTHRITRGKLLRERLPAHGTLLLAVRLLTPGEPQYLGSDLHISQGLEVSHWKVSPRRVAVTLTRPGNAEGAVALRLPRPPKKALLDGEECTWESIQGGVYSIALKFNQKAVLRLHR
jgi:alpha-galactosidase